MSFADMNCSVARTLEIVGEWWTLLVLRDAFLGVRRFEDFVDRLGISRNVLTDRLDTLVDNGILERRIYDEVHHRSEYVLTDRGRDLWPVLTALRQWGDRHVFADGAEPIVVRHLGCGDVTSVETRCGSCGELLEARDVRAEPGPGSVPGSARRTDRDDVGSERSGRADHTA